MLNGEGQKVIITGSTGLLGSYLLRTPPEGAEIYSKRFDILSKDEVYRAFDEAKPDVVIHCAGLGHVDVAQDRHCQAWRVNVEAVETLFHASFHWNARFVLISSNAVYDGENPPYNEESEKHPVNFYGATKRGAEIMAINMSRRISVPLTIIRPILLYGWPLQGGRGNIATRLIQDLQNPNHVVPIANDLYSQPSYAADCAAAIWRAVNELNGELEYLNIAPRDKISLFDFAVEVAKTFDLDHERIVPIPSSHFTSLAPRPRDTTFDVTKMESLGINMRPAKEGLKAMKEEKN